MSENEIRDPSPDSQARTSRIHGFAKYFKGYMGVSAVVAAALPVPVAAFRLIPAYSAQVSFLGVYTSLFAFLVLAFLFYSRHWIAHSMFVQIQPGAYCTRPLAAALPLLLILLALGSIFWYHDQLTASIGDRCNLLVHVGITQSASQVLKETEIPDIPRATLLIAIYLSIFILAEAAFVWMALREYLQDLLGISDEDLLEQCRPAKSRPAAV